MRNAALSVMKAGLVTFGGWALAASMLFLLPGIVMLFPAG
jgi:hypothetical protein